MVIESGQVLMAIIGMSATVISLMVWLVKHGEKRIDAERTASETRVNAVTDRCFAFLQSQNDTTMAANKVFADSMGHLASTLDRHSEDLRKVGEGVAELLKRGGVS